MVSLRPLSSKTSINNDSMFCNEREGKHSVDVPHWPAARAFFHYSAIFHNL